MLLAGRSCEPSRGPSVPWGRPGVAGTSSDLRRGPALLRRCSRQAFPNLLLHLPAEHPMRSCGRRCRPQVNSNVRKAKGRSQAGDDQRPDSWVPVGGVSEVEVMAPSFSRTSSIAFTSSLLPGGPATVLDCDRFRRSAGGCLCAVTSSPRRRFGCSCGKLLACEVLVAVSNSALHAPGAGDGQW